MASLITLLRRELWTLMIPSLTQIFCLVGLISHNALEKGPICQMHAWTNSIAKTENTSLSTTQNTGCPSIMTPSKMGKTKNLLFSFLVRIVLFLNFISRIYLSKILLHNFTGFISIIKPFMKINVSIQETKIIAWRSSRA